MTNAAFFLRLEENVVFEQFLKWVGSCADVALHRTFPSYTLVNAVSNRNNINKRFSLQRGHGDSIVWKSTKVHTIQTMNQAFDRVDIGSRKSQGRPRYSIFFRNLVSNNHTTSSIGLRAHTDFTGSSCIWSIGSESMNSSQWPYLQTSFSGLRAFSSLYNNKRVRSKHLETQQTATSITGHYTSNNSFGSIDSERRTHSSASTSRHPIFGQLF